MGERTCISCQQATVQDQLLPFVRSAEGMPLLDMKGKLAQQLELSNKRHAYCCPTLDCLRLASANNGRTGRWQRSWKESVRIHDPELWVLQIYSLLEKELKGLLSIANRSRGVLLGVESIQSSVGKVRMAIMAKDISKHTREKLFKALPEEKRKNIIATPFSKKEIAQCLGCGEVAVLGFLANPLQKKIANRLLWLSQLVQKPQT